MTRSLRKSRVFVLIMELDVSDTKLHSTTKVSSEKSFGIVFSIVFFIVGTYPLFFGGGIRFWSIALGFFLLFSAYFTPKLLKFPNKLWFKFGMMLGAVVAPILMAAIFFLTVVPTGLLMRLVGKDLLYRKLDPHSKSYWIVRDSPMGSMRNQF